MAKTIDPRIVRLIALANTKNPDLADAPLTGPRRTTRGRRQIRLEGVSRRQRATVISRGSK